MLSCLCSRARRVFTHTPMNEHGTPTGARGERTAFPGETRMSPDLRFAVLGPVRAWRGNAELGVGAPQQQAVLAMLLLANGRQVALDAVISGLWDNDPPLAATGTIRTYVSRLRHRLDGAGRDGAGRGGAGRGGAAGV